MKHKQHPFSRLLSILLGLSMLIPIATGAAYSLGDVNGDQQVNASDAADILIEASLIGSGDAGQLSDEQRTAADVNTDGVINATDAADVLIYTANIGSGSFTGSLAQFLQKEEPTTESTQPPATEPPTEPPTQPPATEVPTQPTIDRNGTYTSPEDVAAYIHTFSTLPSNFITKKEAQALGWVNTQGNLWDVAPGKSIGGDYFSNYQKVLPDGSYHECDVNYAGGYRGAERLVYSTDGRIYYTNDHYSTFTQLY